MTSSITGNLTQLINRKQIITGNFHQFLQNALVFLIFLKIFINPFPQITAVHEICFYMSVLIFAILLYRREISFSLNWPFSTTFLIFVSWTLIGLFFAINFKNSIHDIYSHLIKYMITFYLIVTFLNSREHFLKIVWIIVISTTVYSIWQMFSYYVIMGMGFSSKLKHAMPEEIPTNVIGIMTVFALASAIYLLAVTERWKQKIFLALCAVILMICTLATQTRGAILAMIIVLLLSFLMKRRLGLYVLLALLVFIAVMPVKNRLSFDSIASKLRTDDRILIWYTYWEIIKDYPITGVGFGMQSLYDEDFLRKYNERVPEAYRNPDVYKAPHNFIVDIATRTGLVGLFLFFSIIAAFFRLGWKLLSKKYLPLIRDGSLYLMLAMTAILLQGLLENTMSGPPALIMFFILAMMALLKTLAEGDAREHTATIKKRDQSIRS